MIVAAYSGFLGVAIGWWLGMGVSVGLGLRLNLFSALLLGFTGSLNWGSLL